MPDYTFTATTEDATRIYNAFAAKFPQQDGESNSDFVQRVIVSAVARIVHQQEVAVASDTIAFDSDILTF